MTVSPRSRSADAPMAKAPSTLLIACGALAREILALVQAQGWTEIAVTCLPAHYHNRPEKIPEAVRGKIREGRRLYYRILILYGHSAKRGRINRVLAEEGVER